MQGNSHCLILMEEGFLKRLKLTVSQKLTCKAHQMMKPQECSLPHHQVSWFSVSYLMVHIGQALLIFPWGYGHGFESLPASQEAFRHCCNIFPVLSCSSMGYDCCCSWYFDLLTFIGWWYLNYTWHTGYKTSLLLYCELYATHRV